MYIKETLVEVLIDELSSDIEIIYDSYTIEELLDCEVASKRFVGINQFLDQVEANGYVIPTDLGKIGDARQLYKLHFTNI